MLSEDKFLQRFMAELREIYSTAEIQGQHIIINNENSKITIPLGPIFQQYRMEPNFKKIFEENIENIQEILNQYNYKVDYSSVYPLLKHKDYAEGNNIKYFKKRLFESIDIYFAQDMGDMFRFILQADDGVDFERLEQEAYKNLNKITNVLSRLDKNYEIYVLRFSSDYAASMILNHSVLNQIYKKVGKDFLFCIPSASTLIVANNYSEYINIIKSIVHVDLDPNKITKEIFRCNNGVYTVVNDEKKQVLRVVK